MVSGRTPNHARRQLVAELRRRGLSLAEIARSMGVSRQAVFSLVRYAGLSCPRGVPCTACGALIPTPAALREDRPGALCLPCLERTPDATTGQRLRAYRLAVGLSRAHVAWLAGMERGAVQSAERDKRPLGPDALARVAHLLGIPGTPSVCALRLPPAAVRALRVLLAVARAGPEGLVRRLLAENTIRGCKGGISWPARNDRKMTSRRPASRYHRV